MTHSRITTWLTMAGLLLSASSALAVGRWNTPGTFCQTMGGGYGAGYHAPICLGPCWKTTVASPGVRHLRAPLRADESCCGCRVATTTTLPAVQDIMVMHSQQPCQASAGVPIMDANWMPTESYQPTVAPLFAPPAMRAAPSVEHEDVEPNDNGSEPASPSDEELSS